MYGCNKIFKHPDFVSLSREETFPVNQEPNLLDLSQEMLRTDGAKDLHNKGSGSSRNLKRRKATDKVYAVHVYVHINVHTCTCTCRYVLYNVYKNRHKNYYKYNKNK